MTDVEIRSSAWDALSGPGDTPGPAGFGGVVADRLDPSRARPALRSGIEAAELTGVRGTPYVMLRSPDEAGSGYLRLTPEEWQLALLMDGTQTVSRLVAEFARLAGRLAPDQVRRVVADLAANGMLDELPDDAFHQAPVDQARHSRPAPRRRGLSFAADPLVTFLHRAGGRILFSKAVVLVGAVLSLAGLVLFAATWWRGSRPLFLTGGSYLAGALTLILLAAIAVMLHELGHALATKHAGREVGRAGIALRSGPAIYADTSDAWMAGRGARVRVTAAGPATSLALAGVVQLLAVALPAAGPVAFKLAFVWYLHLFLQLNPFLDRDGSRLLMDWLEIPHLRGRGLAWLSARLRGRPPAWSGLDREGKIIALYGILAVLWTVVALNMAWQLWSDRLRGVTTGLWHGSAGGKLLLVVIVLGLCAPVLVPGIKRLGRTVRKARQRAAERDRDADLPRRIAALHHSELGGLPQAALESLAARARWIRPPSGTPLVVSGSAQQAVYVVVEGAVQARKPGDPGGIVRHHVGPGGVVGLADALTGRSMALDWFTAGTTLLAVPTAAVATVIGPLPGPPPAERAEAEALFADTPALAGLAGDERLALIASAHPVGLPAGAPVILAGPTHAVVVESGVVAMPDGVELRRGTLIGPVGDGSPGAVAETRTPSRLWIIPDAAGLPPLVGDPRRIAGGGVPVSGMATGAAYPPLAAPPGPPEHGESYDTDRRFERRMWSAALLVALGAVGITAVSFAPAPAWAEMPADRAMLVTDEGTLTATVDGTGVDLAAGERRYVEAGALIEVPKGATGRVTFPGGGAVVFCGGSKAKLGDLRVDGGRQLTPHGALTVRGGRVLADTASTSGAYEPLVLDVTRPADVVTNLGASWFAVDPEAVAIAAGRVYVDGTPTMANVTSLSCSDGVPVEPPAGTPSATPGASPSAPPTSVPPSPSASASPSSSPTPVETEETEAPAPDPTTTTTRAPEPEPEPTRTTSSPRPTFTRPTSRPAPTRTTPAPAPTSTSAPTPPTESSASASASAQASASASGQSS
ncbi:cyclic nucleotide-binding protein [Symbioplanes lichenis]|uniref:cyclic nucleotide-binding protein n=1 Tax=Symbioplanes lichenis TaxID=1629072 RepID=UPI002739F4A2|nr:cyclic nucleotide-binding protein [Actinoplanes lichenis]